MNEKLERIFRVATFTIGFMSPLLGLVLYFKFKKTDADLAQEAISGFWTGIAIKILLGLIVLLFTELTIFTYVPLIR